jgi:RNA polymerase sigma factor (sigma-70 family)
MADLAEGSGSAVEASLLDDHVRAGGSVANEPQSRLEDLYRLHGARAVRLAFLLTGDREIANDIAQDAFVRVMGRFGAIRRGESLDAYLRQTVVNLARNQLRRWSLERRKVPKDQSEAGHTVMPDIDSRSVLWELVRRLPPRQRMALVLRYYEDLSERQAAEAMGVSERALNALVSRGLGQLRQMEGWETWTT